MFYIIKDEKLQIFDDDREKLKTTLEFMPQLQDERLLETDIITAEELSQHSNKVLIEDIQIEIDVPDFEEREITKEIEVPDFETVTKTEEIQIGEDDDGNPIYETREWQEEIQTGTHFEIVTETQTVQVGSHKETITVKGLVLNPDYEDEEAQKERERLNLLSMTKREMFLGLYQAKQITPDMLKAQITDPQALIEFEYANDYYRGNPLIDVIGGQLGFTSEQLDKFFITKDYHELLDISAEEQTSEAVDTPTGDDVKETEKNSTLENEEDIPTQAI